MLDHCRAIHAMLTADVTPILPEPAVQPELLPIYDVRVVAGLMVIASQLAWNGTALSRNWAAWLTNSGAYWNRAPCPESG